ncbi:hypothetical protein [Kordiimonas sp.]|uniref:hypothetical protein n=1 Tax=Kordiimonas sp. TaxID=1970157 RepID=UPI003A940D1E
MHVLRVVFRIDFPSVCTKYIDRMGTAIEILHSDDEEFWNNITATPNSQTYTGYFKSPGEEFRDLTFSPTTLSGSIEFLAGGIPGKQLLSSDPFEGMSKRLNNFFREFEVTKVARAGIRFYVSEKVIPHARDIPTSINENMHPDISKIVSAEMGKISDYAALYEGVDEDELEYRLTFGPLHKEDCDKIFQFGREADVIRFQELGYNMIYDIDLYERNFSIKELSEITKWSRSKLKKATNVVHALKQEAEG